MHRYFRVFSAVLAIVASLTALIVSPPSAWADQEYGASLAGRWQRYKARIEKVLLRVEFNMPDHYCLPPLQPSKDNDLAFLNDLEKQLLTMRNQDLPRLRDDLENLKNDETGQTEFTRGTGYDFVDAETIGSLTNRINSILLGALRAKKRQVEGWPVKDCRKVPPPKQQPTDYPGFMLPTVELVEVAIPPVPKRFCSQAEKDATRKAFHRAHWDFYFNYQSAREYENAIADAIAKGYGNQQALRRLWPKATAQLQEQTKRLDDFFDEFNRAMGLPVVDCGGQQQTVTAPPNEIKQPDYELLTYPEVPPRFCTQAEKDSIVGQLKAALRIAERNYDKGNAKVSEIAALISKGDNSKATSDAFRTASNATASLYKIVERLRADISKAEAMPVVDCEAEDKRAMNSGLTAPSDRDAVSPGDEVIYKDDEGRTVIYRPVLLSGDGLRPSIMRDQQGRVVYTDGQGHDVTFDEQGRPQPVPPASLEYVPRTDKPVMAGGPRTSDGIVTVAAGYVETDTPEQFIGRVVIGGGDFAMIYTPGTLDGFFGEIDGEAPLDNEPFWGMRSSFDFRFRYSDVEGDAFREIAADPGANTGFVFIDPLDPTVPFPVGLAGANLAWEAHASSSSIDAAAMALYMEYRDYGPGMRGVLGVGAELDFGDTEHNTLIENFDFPGFRVHENYDLSTVAFGPRFEAGLDWDCDDEEGPIFGGNFYGRVRVHVSPQYAWRDIEVTQRAMGPPALLGGFDHSQRVEFDEDGFNLRYGVNAEVGLKFNERTTVFLKAGWQGDTDAPTIIPADGSFAPGTPIRADTEDASEWYVGVGMRTQFDW